jgi:hypothetical protein
VPAGLYGLYGLYGPDGLGGSVPAGLDGEPT